jgi:ClpP class serine protease
MEISELSIPPHNYCPITSPSTLGQKQCVVLLINSPGGSPVQSYLIHDYIREQADKNNAHVVVMTEDVAASGGYMIACAGDEILANGSSIVGSIGVISAG